MLHERAEELTGRQRGGKHGGRSHRPGEALRVDRESKRKDKEERLAAKMQRDFGRADAIREELRVRLGVLVHDALTLTLT